MTTQIKIAFPSLPRFLTRVRVLLLTIGLVLLCASPLLALEVSDVTARQRWPWNNLVDVDFVLTTNGTESASVFAIDISGTYANGQKTVTASTFTTSAEAMAGANRVTWNLGIDYPNLKATDLTLTVTASENEFSSNRLYMILDLTQNTISYRGASFAEQVNAESYKTTNMVLRYVAPGSFVMGENSTTQAVTLSKGFYIGVFEVTQGQWATITGGYPPSLFSKDKDRAMRPTENVSYDDIRGTSNGTNWPSSAEVDSASFIATVRRNFHIATCDLPTEAQWEYACRAGTTTYYNDGNTNAPNDGMSLNPNESNAFINVLGRYKWNGGFYWNGTAWVSATSSFGPTNGTAIAGSFQPNAWGLYDMHGNVTEWCLDWYSSSLGGGPDPTGPLTGSKRVGRGGHWYQSASNCRCAVRDSLATSNRYNNYGFRLAWTMP